jgi:hypothetical protein
MSDTTSPNEHGAVVPADPVRLRAYERQAAAITYCAPTAIPDVLWHPDYARALWEQDSTIPDASIPERLEVLRDRQRVVFREGEERGPGVCVYTTVDALMSEVVGHELVMAQRRHLAEVLRRQESRLMFRIITERSVPADQFVLLESLTAGDVVYVPGRVPEQFLTGKWQIDAHQSKFNRLDGSAWRSPDSNTFLFELPNLIPRDVRIRETG